MVDQVIRARFDFSNTPGNTPNRPIPQGGAAIQQADGKLLTIKPDGTLRVTDIRDITDQLATGPLAGAFSLKADLVNGRVPLAQLPPGFGGGGPTTVTASQITDASASGRSVLTGTPAAGRSALGLGTAAVLAVGVSGGVAAFDDPRFGTGGGGGAPSTVTASQISDASGSGRSVLTGTPLQGRNALEFAGIQATTLQPPWTNGTGQWDRFRVSVGPTDASFWAGGDRDKPADQQTLGCYSAITGTLNIPVESNQAVVGGTPVTIISAAISGLVQTSSNQNVGVGLFANARVNVPNGRVWGLNVVTSNFSSSFNVPQYGNAAQINGIEIDCTWKGTQNPTTGSNLLGIWIPAEFTDGRPDGAADAIRIGRYGLVENSFPWKNFLSSDHGGAERFAQLGMAKHPEADGQAGGQGLYWITSSGGKKTGNSDTNQYHHSYLEVSPGGDIVLQPDKFGGSGALLVAANNVLLNHSIHPINGFQGARATLGTISITGSATINGNVSSGSVNTGNMSASGNGSFGGSLSCNGGATLSSVTTGGLAVNGNGSFQSLTYQGVAVQLSPSGSIPGNAKALIVVGL